MTTFLEAALGVRPKKLRKLRPVRASVNFSVPVTMERKYQAALVRVVAVMRSAIEEILIPQLPGLVAENKLFNPRDHQDQESVAERLAALIAATRVKASETLTEAEIQELATAIASEVDERNKASISRAFKSAVGIDLFLDEPFVRKEIENFSRENVSLIRATQEEFLQNTERVVFEGFRGGIRHEQIAQSILGQSKDYLERTTRWTTAKNRAKVIARDQINKLNGQLNELRQEAAGLKKWRWRTVGDDRVRPEHRKCNGHVFTFRKNEAIDGSGVIKPRGSLNPGQDIQCRCYAEPIFEV